MEVTLKAIGRNYPHVCTRVLVLYKVTVLRIVVGEVEGNEVEHISIEDFRCYVHLDTGAHILGVTFHECRDCPDNLVNALVGGLAGSDVHADNAGSGRYGSGSEGDEAVEPLLDRIGRETGVAQPDEGFDAHVD